MASLIIRATVFCCVHVSEVPDVVGKKIFEPSMEKTMKPCDAQ